MQPYDVRIARASVKASPSGTDIYRDVLEHAFGYAVVSVVWGLVLLAALGALLS